MEGTGCAEPLLLVDSCGPRASLALFVGAARTGEMVLPERSVAATLLGGVEELLRKAGVALAPPLALGVVHGPGSFTGVRVGLAMVKGLAEAAGLRVAAVSRLAVLQAVAGDPLAVAVLWAGRDEIFWRDERGNEGIRSSAEIGDMGASHRLVCAQEDAERFVHSRGELTAYPLHAADAFWLVRQELAKGGCDLRRLDAHYLRDEGTIYRRTGSAA